MRILLIGCFDSYLHPYVEKYISIFKKNNVSYNFVYWNRSNRHDIDDHNAISFDYNMNSYRSFIYKIKGYLKYRSFVLKLMKREKYDKLVFLTTQSAMLFYKMTKKFKGKYLFDYRDVTYEKFSFYKKLTNNIVKNSINTIISSKGFLSNFNDNYYEKIILCHNTKGKFEIEKLAKTSSDKIRVVFWGMVRQVNYYKNVFDFFSKNENFSVHIYGDGYLMQINQIIRDKKYKNIFVHGPYKQETLKEIAKNTDILLNCYSNNSIQKNALTVKMYEGIKYMIPMVIQKDSYMDKYLLDVGYPHYSIDFDNCVNEYNFGELNLENVNVSFILEDQAYFDENIEKFVKE